MDGLEETFGEQIEFVALDIDLPETEEERHKYGLFKRSTYVLVDENGEMLRLWVGPLDAENMEGQVASMLPDNG